MGFFRTTGFYPDFILWVKEANGSQKIVFVEPHGMRNEDPPPYNEKVNLYLALRDLSDHIIRKDGREILLDSYIISGTPYEVLGKQWGEGWTRERFARKHVLFEEDLEARIAALLAPRDELERRIFASYPYTLAFGFRTLTAVEDPRDLYREQLRFAENILAFLGSVCLALLKEEDRGKADLDLRTFWSRGSTFGGWKQIIQRSAEVFDTYRKVPLAAAIKKLNIRSETKGFGRNIFELIRARNAYAHYHTATDVENIAHDSEQVQETLRRCMEALAFLTEYPVLQVEEVQADPAGKGFLLRCLRYVGAYSDMPREERYSLRALHKNELYLDLGDDNWVSLYPFLVPGTRLGSEATQVYFIDHWDSKKGRARVKSFQRGHILPDPEVSNALTTLLQRSDSQGVS